MSGAGGWLVVDVEGEEAIVFLFYIFFCIFLGDGGDVYVGSSGICRIVGERVSKLYFCIRSLWMSGYFSSRRSIYLPTNFVGSNQSLHLSTNRDTLIISLPVLVSYLYWLVGAIGRSESV